MEVNARPLSRETLRTRARALIRTQLLEGHLAPAGRVNESALAASLGLSRTPLREALLGLEKEGLLVSSPGRGFFVLPLSVNEVREIYPVLWTLECLALRLRGIPTARELDRLSKTNAKLQQRLHEPRQALQLDTQWHRALLAGCPNARLLGMIAMLKRAAHRYEYAFMQKSGRVMGSVEQHQHILEALGRGDLEDAVKTLKENWRVTLECAEEWLTSGTIS